MSSLKSNDKAIACRVEGNKFYSDRSFHKALLKYNESLCFGSGENLGLAYANRSAVYFEVKLFEKCLTNIEMAKQNKYPEMNLEVLSKREEKCRALMQFETKATESIFKLSYSANKKLPFVIDSLELRENKKYGRHIITNKSLRAGDIVAIEQPFCCVLLSESKFVKLPESNIYQRCANCLKDNAFDLIPCLLCCRGLLS